MYVCMCIYVQLHVRRTASRNCARSLQVQIAPLQLILHISSSAADVIGSPQQHHHRTSPHNALPWNRIRCGAVRYGGSSPSLVPSTAVTLNRPSTHEAQPAQLQKPFFFSPDAGCWGGWGVRMPAVRDQQARGLFVDGTTEDIEAW